MDKKLWGYQAPAQSSFIRLFNEQAVKKLKPISESSISFFTVPAIFFGVSQNVFSEQLLLLLFVFSIPFAKIKNCYAQRNG
jgi:hypothetical protein